MPLKQVGGRGLSKQQREESKRRTERRTERKRARKKSSDKRKQELLKQGFQLKNRIFLDRGNYGILKQLKLNTYYKVSKYFISGHGSPMDTHFKVPDNIIIMYLGVMGNLTIINSLASIDGICNGRVIPNSIILPGEMAPNVSLNGEKDEAKISGIFECGSPPKRVLNNYLVPKQDVIDSYIIFQGIRSGLYGLEIMKDPETGEYPISTENNYESDLEKTVHAISKLLNKNTYAFVYLDSCLGGECSMPMTHEEFNTIVNPEKFNILRTGDTLNENPYRVTTVPGALKSGKTIVTIQEMQLAQDDDHWYYRRMLKNFIDKYDFSMYQFVVYNHLEKYYEYDINDLKNYVSYANQLTTEDRDFSHFVAFTDMHVRILEAFKKKDRDEIFKLTRKENALRFNLDPIKYAFLARKYGMTDIPLEQISHKDGIFDRGDVATQVNKNIKNINDLAVRLSKKKTTPPNFLYTLWEQYTKNPLLRSDDDTLFSDFWFDDQGLLEYGKNEKSLGRLTRIEDEELQNLQKAHDYYTITSFMIEIIQTIDFYEEKPEGRLEVFKNTDLPSYNMEYVQKIMEMAMDYVISEDYINRQIAYKDKIIKQLEDMNTMIENYISQSGGGYGGDFLTAIFKFFGF